MPGTADYLHQPSAERLTSATQALADLQKIASVKQRAATKEAAAEVKGSPDGLSFLAAVKAVDRAIRVAGEQRNERMFPGATRD